MYEYALLYTCEWEYSSIAVVCPLSFISGVTVCTQACSRLFMVTLL